MSGGTRLSPLASPDFRYFFIGQVVNRLGGSMAGVALAFAVLEIDDSASALGWVVASSSIPMVVFMLLGGAIADRLPGFVNLTLAGSWLGSAMGDLASDPRTGVPQQDPQCVVID